MSGPSEVCLGTAKSKRLPGLLTDAPRGMRWRQVEWRARWRLPGIRRKLQVLKLFLPATITLLATLAILTACADTTPALEEMSRLRPRSRLRSQHRRPLPRFPPKPRRRDPPPRPGRRRPVLRLLEPTATPAPLRVLAPLQALDSSALLSALSDTEKACIGDNPEKLARSLAGPGSAPREEQAKLIGCLEDETLARIFLAGFVPGPRPLSQETSDCVRAGFAAIDPRTVMTAGIEGDPGRAMAGSMAALSVNDSVPERRGVGGGRVNDGNATRGTEGDAVPLGPTGRAGRNGRGNDSGGGGGLHRPGQGGGGLRAGHGAGTRPGARKDSSGAHGDRGSPPTSVPTPAPGTGTSTPVPTRAGPTATTTLVIIVAPIPADIPEYDRGDWKHWVDSDGDCQDARQEVLVAESLEQVTFETDRGCRVETGQVVRGLHRRLRGRPVRPGHRPPGAAEERPPVGSLEMGRRHEGGVRQLPRRKKTISSR